MTDMGTGWELNKRTHVDGCVVNYGRIRPECSGGLMLALAHNQIICM